MLVIIHEKWNYIYSIWGHLYSQLGHGPKRKAEIGKAGLACVQLRRGKKLKSQ